MECFIVHYDWKVFQAGIRIYVPIWNGLFAVKPAISNEYGKAPVPFRKRRKIMGNIKTNAMRILDKAGIPYVTYEYDNKDGLIDGVSVAGKIGQPVERVYKTLVTKGASGGYYVFVIPVANELDLKAAARSVNEKSVEMIKVADINRVTGYIRGGCSPIGMKKDYATVIDISCKNHNKIILSAGRIGCQMELSPDELVRIAHCSVDAIAR